MSVSISMLVSMCLLWEAQHPPQRLEGQSVVQCKLSIARCWAERCEFAQLADGSVRPIASSSAHVFSVEVSEHLRKMTTLLASAVLCKKTIHRWSPVILTLN